jgi:DNA-directed RNA polymerase specialized sigma24 family protein
MDTVTGERGSKRRWPETAAAFQHLLAWFDEGVDSHGARYEEIRRRLVAYFERKRCRSPHDLADETLNRVSRRLEEAGTIADAAPARYCYIIARYVFLEYLRSPERAQSSLSANAAPSAVVGDHDEQTEHEQRFACLDRCLDGLTTADRELILEYYAGETRSRIDHRRALAARLRLSANALTIRACRIRDRLEACVTVCLSSR